uniref:Uncharacterized protein n=1 Tax=Megaselia scalaris TaxID=36166 RepID=T1GEL2_MEGSC
HELPPFEPVLSVPTPIIRAILCSTNSSKIQTTPSMSPTGVPEVNASRCHRLSRTSTSPPQPPTKKEQSADRCSGNKRQKVPGSGRQVEDGNDSQLLGSATGGQRSPAIYDTIVMPMEIGLTKVAINPISRHVIYDVAQLINSSSKNRNAHPRCPNLLRTRKHTSSTRLFKMGQDFLQEIPKKRREQSTTEN